VTVQLKPGSARPCDGAPIPDFHFFDVAPVAWNIDGAGSAARTDALAHTNLFPLTVAEANHHTVEVDGSALHTQLKTPEHAFAIVYADSVVIPSAIHICLT
jgi:hypothetical protein